MNDLLIESAFFGVVLSLFAYEIGLQIKKRMPFVLCNPMLIAIIITMVILIACNVEYDVYYASAKYLSYLLTPTTVCLAIPLYEQIELLKGNWKAIILGIGSGVLTSLISIFGLSLLMGFNHEEYVTLLPKSVTTAIGMGISEELGGYVSITVATIAITGIFGNIIAESICRIFKIEEPIAKGIAIGTASHAMGTVKAMEMGEVEGSMSGLSIAVSGLLTVVAAGVFSTLI